MSQLTTHVLNTSTGKPAHGVNIILYEKVGADWLEVARGITNTDGRISNLLKDDEPLPFAVYKMSFETGPYFTSMHTDVFYPVVDVQFSINTAGHYHIPLLLSPYGYSTYRGS
jgi:5-hydroxyisourate hydrolase